MHLFSLGDRDDQRAKKDWQRDAAFHRCHFSQRDHDNPGGAKLGRVGKYRPQRSHNVPRAT